MIDWIINGFKSTNDRLARYDEMATRDRLMKLEAIVGGDIFGEVPADRYREFYCQDEKTWVWHEQWSENGTPKEMITTYDVRPDGVYKSFNEGEFLKVSPVEIIRLYEAAKRYRTKIKREVYQFA